MAITNGGYRYIKTSAGYLKCLYIECDTKLGSVGQLDFSNAIGTIYPDCTIGLARNSNKNGSVISVYSSDIDIGGLKTYYSGSQLRASVSGNDNSEYLILGSIGYHRTEPFVSVSPITLIKYSDKYCLCNAGTFEGKISDIGFIQPNVGKWGYVAGGTKNAFLPQGFNIPNTILQNYLEKSPPLTSLPNDPYLNGDTSTSGGGGGTFGGGNTIFGGNSDSIDIPPLPTASASSAGFITLFNPSLAQLNNLANYMWSDLFSLDTFKKIFADPMDCILGLSIVPVKPASAGTSAVKIGNVSTDVSMNKTSSQYVTVDCGTIDVKEYWGAYLDYAPYTQCEIYLPYVGTKQISVDDVMNKSVHVVYHVDILSGACNAYVKCGDSVLYTFVGQCSSSIPISGNDWTNVLNGAISVAGKIGLAMATGGATALMSGLGAASSIISSSKPTVERSGAMSSTGGLLGIQKPYLILTRPKQALPENQNKYTGYPSFITMALSECTGYTEIDSIHLENMSCTDEEAQEIENLLKSGVIF